MCVCSMVYDRWLHGVVQCISHGIDENLERINPGTNEEDNIYDQVRRAVDVVTALKSLPPGELANTTAVKMADEVLKHLAMSTSGGQSGMTSSTAIQSQAEGMDKKITQMVVYEPPEPSSLEITISLGSLFDALNDEDPIDHQSRNKATSTSRGKGTLNEDEEKEFDCKATSTRTIRVVAMKGKMRMTKKGKRKMKKRNRNLN
ncbi:hypothetical protein Sjap_024011 [Stephania japonica]|uniref:Uncharacterized protein n=1 Tax=Stephania japonica TaxID=461633 RepID=A0AAP0ELB3_9MAGN